MTLLKAFFYLAILAPTLMIGIGAFIILVRLVLAEYKSRRNTESSK